jgi:uroporphyrinogen decarboxylase
MIDSREEGQGTRNALLDVLNGRPAERRPIWFMRQAGRYLPEYRAVREKAGSFVDLCYNPELAAEVTVQPLRRYDFDAAILFADILVVPHAMGLPLKFEEGEGPVLGTVRSMDDLNALKPVKTSHEVAQVCKTVALTRSLLPKDKALIGFCGAPWTVASYMVAGGSSDRVQAKVAAYQRQPWFMGLIEALVRESIDYLCAQADAGAQAVQIFDSWAGDLVGTELDDIVFKPIAAIVKGVKARHPDLPVIVFARGVGQNQVRAAAIPGTNAIGVETETDLASLPKNIVVQGNLDPIALFAGEDVARREAARVCARSTASGMSSTLAMASGSEPILLSWVLWSTP